MRAVLILVSFFISGCFSAPPTPAPYSEMTDRYQLPSGMEGHKIYVLGGGWTATYPLWIIVSPEGEVVKTR
jgi:hypothetical protein